MRQRSYSVLVRACTRGSEATAKKTGRNASELAAQRLRIGAQPTRAEEAWQCAPASGLTANSEAAAHLAPGVRGVSSTGLPTAVGAAAGIPLSTASMYVQGARRGAGQFGDGAPILPVVSWRSMWLRNTTHEARGNLHDRDVYLGIEGAAEST